MPMDEGERGRWIAAVESVRGELADLREHQQKQNTFWRDRITELREALRSHVIGKSYADDTAFENDVPHTVHCIQCNTSWPRSEGEHAPDCLAKP